MGKLIDFRGADDRLLKEDCDLAGIEEELSDLAAKLTAVNPAASSKKKEELRKIFLQEIRKLRAESAGEGGCETELSDEELDAAAGGMRNPSEGKRLSIDWTREPSDI